MFLVQRTLDFSVLNQNNNICLTANSPLSGLLYELDTLKKHGNVGDTIENFPDTNSYSNVVKYFNNYYSDWKQNIFSTEVYGAVYLKL